MINNIDVAGIINNKHGKILMLYHNKLDLWTIPAGKAEYNELPQNAIIRELKEEVNIDIIRYELFKSDIILTNHIAYVYIIHNYIGIPINMEKQKHKEMKYFSIDEIKSMKNITIITSLIL